MARLNNAAKTTSEESTFSIEVLDNCRVDTVQLSSETEDFEYLIKEPAEPREVQPVFEQLHTQCPFEITVQVDGSTGLDDSLFVFDQESGKLKISTADIASFDGQSKSIAITYTSTLSESDNKSATDTFLVSFKDPCHDTELSAATLDQTSYTFALWEKQQIAFTDAEESLGTCGSFTYSLEGIDTDVYSIEFSDELQKHVIKAQPSVKETWLGSHKLQVKATLQKYEDKSVLSEEINIEIVDPCLQTEIILDQKIEALESTIEGPTVVRSFQEFPNSADVGYDAFGSGKSGAQTYRLTMADDAQ